MNPLASLRRIRLALRLYDQLARGETDLLVEQFPFVKSAFTVRVVIPAPPEPKKPLPPPQVTYTAHTEDDELRDALDIGFSQLKFDPLDNNEA